MSSGAEASCRPAFPVHFLVGPTATGKTAVAQAIAEADRLDILSVDSMLVYRGMDIGTAKPTAEERARVRYWGIDLVDAGERFSAADYRRAAVEACISCGASGRRLIAAGGTGLYVSVLLRGLEPASGPDAELRLLWEESMRREGPAPLQAEVRRLAPALYESLSDKENPRRLIRALELARAGAAVRPSGWKATQGSPPVTGLKMDSQLLRRRIELRVESMFAGGLLEETASLLEGGRLAATAGQAIGYAEARAVLEGRCSPDEARAAVIRRTWQLARRQMTWFRHQVPIEWIDVEEGEPVEQTAAKVRASWARHGPASILLDGAARQV